ncbi:MAG: SGNH/GDSL hydrolase family protein [Sedimentisphaerales bacterium]|nr:SGNH/GDSL hydrolase family protein [Sedimentisphaerales bacterium]
MEKCRIVQLVLIAVAAALSAAWGGETVIFDMDTVRHKPTAGPDKEPVGKVSVVPGRFGDACLFGFRENRPSGFFTASVAADEKWNDSAGVSFYVKGDGSKSWAGLEMIDKSDYSLRYAFCFPIDSTQWRKVTVAWRELIPELPGGEPADSKGGYAPSGFGNLWFGKWYYWRDYPAHSFAIDHICLESSISLDCNDYTPSQGGPLKTLEKLKSEEPVTIVTMGDSLSDKRHWANRDILWSEVLRGRLKERFGGEVTLVNPAIGGTQLSQNLILMPRWLSENPQPDLVVVWFGFNDWDAGMRRTKFERILRIGVERIRRLTGGRSEIMLVTTCPAVERWDTMEELALAVRTVAAEKKTALADVSAAFHKAGVEETARNELFCRDKVHLGEQGHRLTAETVFKAIIETQ